MEASAMLLADDDGSGSAMPGPGGPGQPSVVVVPGGDSQEGGKGNSPGEMVEEPAKVMRIGSMIKQLLEEVRQAPLDENSRNRLREIYDTSVRELATGLSSELSAELDRLALPFNEATPSDAELRIAQAQLVGWLEGLFHGIQATLFAQQMQARSQLEEMRRRGLPPGQQAEEGGQRSGTYL
ncbi:MAG TPA: bacterial proteasome activator family protein [Acidimicrobiales bacterium]|nr:bacterial proteasome activator family protein [Acidimicrobiales bacterium]